MFIKAIQIYISKLTKNKSYGTSRVEQTTFNTNVLRDQFQWRVHPLSPHRWFPTDESYACPFNFFLNNRVYNIWGCPL